MSRVLEQNLDLLRQGIDLLGRIDDQIYRGEDYSSGVALSRTPEGVQELSEVRFRQRVSAFRNAHGDECKGVFARAGDVSVVHRDAPVTSPVR